MSKTYTFQIVYFVTDVNNIYYNAIPTTVKNLYISDSLFRDWCAEMQKHLLQCHTYNLKHIPLKSDDVKFWGTGNMKLQCEMKQGSRHIPSLVLQGQCPPSKQTSWAPKTNSINESNPKHASRWEIRKILAKQEVTHGPEIWCWSTLWPPSDMWITILQTVNTSILKSNFPFY
jgi:hypothetical protein